MGKGIFSLKEIKIFGFDNHFICLKGEHQTVYPELLCPFCEVNASSLDVIM